VSLVEFSVRSIAGIIPASLIAEISLSFVCGTIELYMILSASLHLRNIPCAHHPDFLGSTIYCNALLDDSGGELYELLKRVGMEQQPSTIPDFLISDNSSL